MWISKIQMGVEIIIVGWRKFQVSLISIKKVKATILNSSRCSRKRTHKTLEANHQPISIVVLRTTMWLISRHWKVTKYSITSINWWVTHHPT